ncbi:copper resistance protein NlpE N-terminal domain-containing protein [Mucilaginibacter pedocola]|nr:copper resistance protein NlpE N-terminal domain-containing protein [Mucilaginibacter pedocola]
MKKIFLIILIWMVPAILFAQTEVEGNVPEKTTSLKKLPFGPSVVGVFDGRSPCQGMAKELQITVSPECFKIKWRLILYQDSVTKAPTTYHFEGIVYRNPAREGKWAIIRGTKDRPNAIVYQLDPDKPEKSIYILKGDDNVLFFLDRNRNLMPGDENFAYTFNRTRP